MKELWEIYSEFFKMGSVTFGGGYAMLPILRKTCVEKRRWISEEQIMDFYAVSQGLPGIIAVNVSVFIGYYLKKMKGGIAAALGVVSPCIIIISIIAALFANFQDNVYVKCAMAGVSVCVCALILDAVMGLWKKGIKDIWGFLLCIGTFAVSAFTDVSPVLIVIFAALMGVLISKLNAVKANGDRGVST